MLIIQLIRFSILDNKAIKDQQFFDCFPNSVLKLPIKLDDEVSFTNKYSLVATINNSGSLDRCHYWTFIKDAHAKHWLSCDDEVVLNVNKKTSSNNSSCPFLFKIISIFYLFIMAYCKAVLSVLVLHLGVITLHITPVTYEG